METLPANGVREVVVCCRLKIKGVEMRVTLRHPYRQIYAYPFLLACSGTDVLLSAKVPYALA